MVEIQSLDIAGLLGAVVILSHTLVELVKFVVHKKRVASGKAHDSLTLDEHAMLAHLRSEASVFPAARQFQNSVEMISCLKQIQCTLARIEQTLKHQ